MHQLFEPDPDCAGGGNGMVSAPPKFAGTNIADCVARFRARKPHVHCITNSVAQHFTANVLLAAGATPSMTIAVREIEDFVGMANALLINLGTMDDARNEAVDIAVSAANRLNKPWALDPVFVQASPIRLEMAKKLLPRTPALVRCNESEAAALFDRPKDTFDLENLSLEHSTTIALTGKIDKIAAPSGSVSVTNGSSMMDKITAMGCALTALMVGFLAVENDHFLASVSAIAFFGLAGEKADQVASGPGSFVPHFLDALHSLTPEEIAAGAALQ